MSVDRPPEDTPGAPPPDDSFFGRMNAPSGAASIRGLCGDEIEFYLYIQDNVIQDVKCYTEGCETTKLCGLAVAARAKGKTPLDALAISPRAIIDSEESLTKDGRHCAILAVSVLYRAIADFMLMP